MSSQVSAYQCFFPPRHQYKEPPDSLLPVIEREMPFLFRTVPQRQEKLASGPSLPDSISFTRFWVHRYCRDPGEDKI